MADVAVHFASLEADATAVAEAVRLLDADERARAEAYRFPRDRRRFIVRRATLRRLLAAETGCGAARLAFERNGFGKPRLRGGPCFSLSHSGERMMVAVGGVEIGCDLERIDASLDWRPLADRFFAPSERRALAALTHDAAGRGFFRCWARKEAYVKALGCGLSYSLTAFDVSVSEEARLIGGGDGWAIAAADFAPDYAAAVVAADDGRPLRLAISDSTSPIASRANSIAAAA